MTCQPSGSVLKNKYVKRKHLKREHTNFSPFLPKDIWILELFLISVLGWSFFSVCHGLALKQNTGAKPLNVFFSSLLVFPHYNDHDIKALKTFFLFAPPQFIELSFFFTPNQKLFFCWIVFYGELHSLKDDFVFVFLQQATCGCSTWGGPRGRRSAGHSPAPGTGTPAWEEGKKC